MSRFFVDSNEEEEYEEDNYSNSNEIEEVSQQKIDEITNQITTILNEILQSLEYSNYDIHNEMNKLEQCLINYKEIMNEDTPSSQDIIKEIVKIKEKIDELSSKNLKNSNLNQISKEFNQKIYAMFQDKINSTSKEEKSAWIVSSDDEEVKRSKKQMRNESGFQKRILFNGQYEEEIDDNLIRNEIEKFDSSRKNGKIIATSKRFTELMNATFDPKILDLLYKEIIQTILYRDKGQIIPNDEWQLSFIPISKLIDEPNLIYPLFDRLNKDYWARTIDLRYLFLPSTSQLHEIFPHFLALLTEFINSISIQSYPEIYVRSANMLIEHIYTDENEDILSLSTSIIRTFVDVPNFQLPDEDNIKARASLFLAYNLAIKNCPVEAAKIFKSIPRIYTSYKHTKLLSNRTRAQIGIAAFKHGYYMISYDMLKAFSNVKAVGKNLGQEPNDVFPSWLLINTNLVIYLRFLSGILIDLPDLAINETNENKLKVHPRLHKDLLKERIAHPETPSEKATAFSDFAKNGEWKKALSIIKEYITDDFLDPFSTDLKKASLCSFLLTAKDFYESISIDFLIEMFDINKDEIKEVLQKMFHNLSPIEDVHIDFNGSLSDDEKFIIF